MTRVVRWPPIRLPGAGPLLAGAALAAVWQACASLNGSGSVPDLPSTLREAVTLLHDPEAVFDILASLRRMAIGFTVGFVVAVPIGLAMGRSRFADAMLRPLLAASYPVPKAALMPLVMLWFGVGEGAKLLVIVLGVTLPVIYHAQQGARRVDEKLIWSAQAMGMTRAARAWRVVLPAALPDILVGARTAIVLALITMITSEMIARQRGAGNILFGALDMAQYETVYAMILLVGVLGVVLDTLFEIVRRAATGWSDPSDPSPGRNRT